MKEKLSPMLPHSVLWCASGMPSVLFFGSEKSQDGELVVLFELVKGVGTDPTHPVAGNSKDRCCGVAVAVSGMGLPVARGAGRLYSGCSTAFTAAGFRVAARVRVCPGTDRTSAANGRGKLAGGCWMGGIATALLGFKVESCSGAGFGLGVVPGTVTDRTSAPNGRGKVAGGC